MKKYFPLLLLIIALSAIMAMLFYSTNRNDEIPFVKNATQDSRLFIQYKGEVSVSGTYSLDKEDYIFDEVVCFDVDESSRKKIPRVDGDSRSAWFCFNNQEEVEKKLGIDKALLRDDVCGVVGKATIVIRDYAEFVWESEGSDSTKLERILSYDEPRLRMCDTHPQ